MTTPKLKITLFVLAMVTLFAACKKDDNNIPVPDEQELITTMKLAVSNSSGFSQTFTYKVENGFGGTTQGTIQIDTVKLAPNSTYTVSVQLLNEKETPAEDITEEVLDERDEHLFLYQSAPSSGAGSIAFSNGLKDNNGEPFNQTITFTTGAAGKGALTVNLIHEPVEKEGLTPAAAGGETDAEAVFPVSIQ